MSFEMRHKFSEAKLISQGLDDAALPLQGIDLYHGMLIVNPLNLWQNVLDLEYVDRKIRSEC